MSIKWIKFNYRNDGYKYEWYDYAEVGKKIIWTSFYRARRSNDRYAIKKITKKDDGGCNILFNNGNVLEIRNVNQIFWV